MKKLDVYLQEIKRQKISVDDLQHAAEILAATPQLPAELENPDLTREKREDLVRSLFPLAVRGIIEVLAQDQTMKMMPDLIKEAETFEKPDKYLRCVLEYVKEPDEKQAAGIRKFLSEKYPGRELRIVKEEKPELGSGFILRVGSEEYDWSTEGRKRALADKLKNLAKEPDSGDFLTQKGIIGILKGNLDGIDISVREIGTVSRVGDGIAYVDGIDHAMYGEIVAFDGDVRGMVQDIRSKEIGCILFGHANTIGEGSRAMRTGKMAGIPVGEGFLGRVVDALGKQCPIPVVMAKKALAELQTPDTLEILVDNEAAVQNLSKLAASCQLPVRAEKTGEKRFSVTMEVSAPVRPAEETVCAPDARGDLVVAVGSNCMGNGKEALGKTLMKGFLYAVSQLPTLPKTMLFYNSGAYLTCAGSDSLEDLKFMEAQGVEIRTCGTCLDFYKLKETLAVGSITNMYAIAETLAAAGKVIKP